MALTPEQWLKVKEIVAQAIELDPLQRESFVQQVCNGDMASYREAMSLLQYDSPLPINIGDSSTSTTHPELILKDRYLVKSKLGQGGFAATYLALDQQLHNRRVVVKILTDFDADPYISRKFQEEIRALSALEHPNIVAPLDSGQLENGAPFLVMQFAEGRTLRVLMGEGSLSLPRIASILKQIGKTLSIVHARGIHHRDLKPENIMIQTFEDGSDHIRLIDFGIASIVERGKVAQTRVVGSLLYMAPEQLRGEASALSDIYALGVIAYELVTGVLPFRAGHLLELSKMQESGVRVLPSELRPELNRMAQKLILQALSFEPSKRPPDAASFVEHLSELLLLPQQRTESHHWSKKRLFLLSLVATLILISGVRWANFWFSRTKASPGNQQHPVLSKNLSVSPPERQEVTTPISIHLLRRGMSTPVLADSEGIIRLRPDEQFRFLIQPALFGHLYIFAETAGKSSLHILFPTPTTMRGMSEVYPSHSFQIPETSWFSFGRSTGVETVQIVWSAKERTEFEVAKQWANEKDRGEIPSGDTRNRILHFLDEKSSIQSGPSPWKLTGNKDIAIGSIQISHQ